MLDTRQRKAEIAELSAQLLALEAFIRSFVRIGVKTGVFPSYLPDMALDAAERWAKLTAETLNTPTADIQTTKALRLLAGLRRALSLG